MKISSELCNKCGKAMDTGYCKECHSATVGDTGRIFMLTNVVLILILVIYIVVDLL